MSTEQAEVRTDQTAADAYEQFVAEQQGRSQQPAKNEAQSEAPPEEAKTETDSDPGKTQSQEPEDEIKWTPKQQKRFDQLTREKHELKGLNRAHEAELTRLRAELAEARKGKPEAAADSTKVSKTDGGPKIEDFGSFEEWVEARAEWKAEQKVHSALAERDKQIKEAEQKAKSEEFAKEFIKGREEFEKTHPDYPEKARMVAEKIHGRPDLDAVIVEFDNVHTLVDHLGANLGDLDRIVGLPPHLAVFELGKVAASLGASSKVPAIPKKTASPPPPGRVDGVGASPKWEDTGDYNQFAREEDAKRKRR